MIFEVFPKAVYERNYDIADLPVELAVLILRRLQPEALYNAAKVSRKWLSICLFDQVLRRRLRIEIQERKKRMVEILTKPNQSVMVTRVGPSSVYGSNVVKSVKVRNGLKNEPYQRCVVEDALKPKKIAGRKPMKGEREGKRAQCRI